MKNISIILVIIFISSCAKQTPKKEADTSQNNAEITVEGEVEKLASGFSFVEGPASDSYGNVYFTDIPEQKIHIWTVTDSLKTFREDSGGANGLLFDNDQNLIACEGYRGRLTSTSKDGEYKILAEQFENKPFNQPNDVWAFGDKGYFFTDPYYGDNEGDIPQDGMHVYYIDKALNSIMRVAEDYIKPNGIVGTQDGKTLYITDQAAGKTFKYDIQPNGFIWNKTLFIDKASDGMTIDDNQNLYITPRDEKTVEIYSPDGTLLKVIEVPEYPSNVSFGGENFAYLYITARTSLYRVKINQN